MYIGVPKEIKNHEYRVGLTPSSVREVIAHGHTVTVETGAGTGIGCSDADYQAAGAEISSSAAEIFAAADMIVKVKEPQPDECKQLREDQLLFTYLHLAPDRKQTELLVASGCTAIAYETVTADDGTLPLLTPMSEVAGRMSIQVGAVCLQKANGGNGILLGGVPGTAPARVAIIGGGVVGLNAARMALGLGADVTVLDRSLSRLRVIDDIFGPRLKTLYASIDNTESAVFDADLIVGAVLVPGAAAPKLVRRAQFGNMKKGTVLVDVAIDQGGCFETSRATTHADPTYVIDNIVHYCVANMPGAVPRTSTCALNNATVPFVLALADMGWKKACRRDAHLLQGLNIHAGRVTYRAVADALDMPYVSAESVI